MPRLVLHIGTHKTGTTTIQDQMHAARETLAQYGVIYPDLKKHTGHHGLLADWIALPAVYHLPGGGISYLRQLAQTWAGTDKTIFLSSEEFSRAGGRGGSVDFSALRRIFVNYELSVICVLRDQLSFLQSVYVELSRRSVPSRPPLFLRDAIETGQVDGLWCDYAGLYMGLRNNFAAEEIQLVDYAKARTDEAGLLNTILARIGPNSIQIPGDQNAKKGPEGWSNRSPEVLPVWAAQVIAGGAAPDPLLLRSTTEAFELEYGKGRTQSLFTREESKTARAHFERRNIALSELVGRDNKLFMLDLPPAFKGQMYRDDITQDLWIRIARRLSYAKVNDAA